MLAFAFYAIVDYPWGLLLSRMGFSKISDDLPEPHPLPDNLKVSLKPDLIAESGIIPEIQEEAVFIRPPAVDLYLLGTIKIPKLEISENVVEGSDSQIYYAVGHVPGTAMPGEEGNCVLAGHRSYVFMRPFRYLDKIEADDKIYITDENNKYTYQVFETTEVEPHETWVMLPNDDETHLLTLITCTPYMVHSHRLIVWCRLMETVPLE